MITPKLTITPSTLACAPGSSVTFNYSVEPSDLSLNWSFTNTQASTTTHTNTTITVNVGAGETLSELVVTVYNNREGISGKAYVQVLQPPKLLVNGQNPCTVKLKSGEVFAPICTGLGYTVDSGSTAISYTLPSQFFSGNLEFNSPASGLSRVANIPITGSNIGVMFKDRANNQSCIVTFIDDDEIEINHEIKPTYNLKVGERITLTGRLNGHEATETNYSGILSSTITEGRNTILKTYSYDTPKNQITIEAIGPGTGKVSFGIRNGSGTRVDDYAIINVTA